VLIAVALSALVLASQPFPPGAPAHEPAAAQAAGDKAPKAGKQPKADKKPKKKKVPKPDVPPSPDEEVDDQGDSAETGTGTRFTWKQHPSFRYGSVFRIDFQAQLQEDAHGSYDGVQGLNTYELHRNRVGLKGKVFKHFEYEIKRELTEKELTTKQVAEGRLPKPLWKDVYLNVKYTKRAEIQVGKFKIPFGLDELTGVTHNDFVYRSLGANYLAPGRDIGFAMHGEWFKHGFTYSTGVFRQDGDNAKSSRIWGADRTVAGRVTVRPLRRLTAGGGALGGLELGTAVAMSSLSNDNFEPNGLRGRTVLTQDTFFPAVYVQGQRRRWEGDADWSFGPVSARTEFTYVTDQRLQQGLGDDDLPDVRYRSWYVSGTWILTGEQKTRPIKPADDLLRGGIGSLELAARWERLWGDSIGGAADGVALRNPRAETILSRGDTALTLGVNWTLNRFMKLQANIVREHLDDIERNPVPNGAAFWSRILRLQFVL